MWLGSIASVRVWVRARVRVSQWPVTAFVNTRSLLPKILDRHVREIRNSLTLTLAKIFGIRLRLLTNAVRGHWLIVPLWVWSNRSDVMWLGGNARVRARVRVRLFLIFLTWRCKIFGIRLRLLTNAVRDGRLTLFQQSLFRQLLVKLLWFCCIKS